jgi:hypothetical protein
MNITQFLIENSVENIKGLKRVNILESSSDCSNANNMCNNMDFSIVCKDYPDVQFLSNFYLINIMVSEI